MSRVHREFPDRSEAEVAEIQEQRLAIASGVLECLCCSSHFDVIDPTPERVRRALGLDCPRCGDGGGLRPVLAAR